jgi:hypothetical protein
MVRAVCRRDLRLSILCGGNELAEGLAPDDYRVVA